MTNERISGSVDGNQIRWKSESCAIVLDFARDSIFLLASAQVDGGVGSVPGVMSTKWIDFDAEEVRELPDRPGLALTCRNVDCDQIELRVLLALDPDGLSIKAWIEQRGYPSRRLIVGEAVPREAIRLMIVQFCKRCCAVEDSHPVGSHIRVS